MAFPLLLVKPEYLKRLSGPFRSIGTRLAAFRPALTGELAGIGATYDAVDYALACLTNSIGFCIFFAAISFAVLSARGEANPALLSVGYGLMFLVVFLVANLFYPKIIANSSGEGVDADLPFALREMALHIEGGVPLFDAMVEVSKSEYGEISKEFGKTVQEISSGYSEKEALERMAVRTKSDFLKKSLWQILATISSGAALAPTLRQIADNIKAKQLSQLKDYTSTLGFLVWIYLILSVVMPAMGITFVVVYAAFSKDLNPTPLIYGIIGISLVVEVAIIGFISKTKPKVNK